MRLIMEARLEGDQASSAATEVDCLRRFHPRKKLHRLCSRISGTGH